MSFLPAFLTTSLDEVVFEGRHQAYGAYQLRQDYKQHLASAGGITLAVGALLLLSWLAWPAAEPKPVTVTPGLVDMIKPPVVAIEKLKQAVTAPPRRAHPALAHQATLSTQVARDKDVPLAPKPAPVEAVVDGPSSITATGPSDDALARDLGGSDRGDASTTEGTTAAAGPYIVVEKMPEFAGGQAALLRYLQKNLRYPATALAAQAEGRVFLSFVIQADGTIADVAILKGLGYGLDEEAQRVVRQMPAWAPGYQNKHAVAVRFTLPITFKIQ